MTNLPPFAMADAHRVTAQHVHFMSTAELKRGLAGRHWFDGLQVGFMDDFGNFVVEVRMPGWSEYIRPADRQPCNLRHPRNGAWVNL